MHKDLRDTALYREVEDLYRNLRRPGTGQIVDAMEVHASPDGRWAVFAGVIADRLEGLPDTRVCLVELTTGTTRVLTFGPNTDRLPKFSPDGRQIAFLSDRNEAGSFQLHLLDPITGFARFTPAVDGWIEYLHWSPDGKRILLGVAEKGADMAGGQGGLISRKAESHAPSWMPTVEAANETCGWRCAWIYEPLTGSMKRVPHESVNIWEAAWCGNDALVAVTSPGPHEGLWYGARLEIIDIRTGQRRELYVPESQLGWPAAAPSGETIAVVEAICSDRWIVAGDLLMIDVATGRVRRIDTRGVDVTSIEWRSQNRVLIAGHRDLETVVSLLDVSRESVSEVWKSCDVSTGGRYVTVSGFGDRGDCVLVGEGFDREPEIAVIRDGAYRAVRSLDVGYADQIEALASVEQIRWQAPDELEIQGWLLRPRGRAPHPLVMYIHGGPVAHWRTMWLGRPKGMLALMLLRHGYAVFFPNPRGSTGRGQNFVRPVLADMGGADTQDLLSGVDHLVARGIADPARLGITGGSYGGFMTAWLVTQDSRFAAAVASSPVINHVTQHLLSNIPQFESLFLNDRYTNPGGRYFQRSPVLYADKVKTPTLISCGALDRCTPAEEAVQFHRALQEHGAVTVLLTYPEEGHGVRKFPAAIDYAARVVSWFQTHMPAEE